MNGKPGGNLFRLVAEKQLGSLVAETPGVRSVVLFSDDGFEVAACATSAEVSGRLAAIGSSLAALGIALSEEAGLGVTERTIVESTDGVVMILRLGTEPALSLAVIAERDVVLGRLIWAVNACCQKLARIVNEFNLPPVRDAGGLP